MVETIIYPNSTLLKTIYGFMISNNIETIEDDYTYNMDRDDTEPTDLDIDISFLYNALEDYTMLNLFNSKRHKYIDYFGFDDTGIIIAIRTNDDYTNDYITVSF